MWSECRTENPRMLVRFQPCPPLYAAIAQLVEYTTDNRAVVGSNPTRCTKDTYSNLYLKVY